MASVPMTSRGITLVSDATMRQEKLVGIEAGDLPGDKIKKQRSPRSNVRRCARWPS